MSEVTIRLGDGVGLPLDKLLYYGALVQGASGSGKSYLLRLINELAAPHVPAIVVDPEGEFASLREKFDFVIVGPDGEIPASPKNAATLARRLLESRTSAVVDIYALDQVQRRLFVRDFFQALRSAPKSLWGPRLITLDEASQFSPEGGHGESVSRPAVELFAAERRKRGWGFVLATQRLSKVSKDAVADLATIIIGRTSPIDQKRAADILGVVASDQRRFSTLKDGRWLITSPVFASTEAREFHASLPQTRPPTPGRKYEPPAPSRAMQKVVGELAELAAKPDDDPVTLEQALERIRVLRGELKRGTGKAVADPAAIEKAVATAVAKALRERDQSYAAKLHAIRTPLRGLEARLIAEAGKIKVAYDIADRAFEAGPPTNGVHAAGSITPALTRPAVATRTSAAAANVSSGGDTSDIPPGERAVLTVCAQFSPTATREQITCMTGYKRSTRDAYVQRLREKGLVEIRGACVDVTDAGLAALGSDYEPLPTGAALLAYWLQRLPEGERKVLEFVARHGGTMVARETISEATGYKRSTRDAYLQRLQHKRVIDVLAGGVAARPLLFD